MLFARIVPIAPFVIVNLVAGAIRSSVISARHLGGQEPGILAVVVLENHLERALSRSRVGNLTLLIGLAIFFALLGAVFTWYGTRPVPAS
jgi:uncharacterized membrane protein YdjX (TVP38/TMEM64 family)